MKALGRQNIHVYRLGLDASLRDSSRISAFSKVLSAGELKRAESLQHQEHRADFIACHAALRLVLGAYLESLPASVKFAEDSSSAVRLKPKLEPESGLRFNLSHTRGAALIGVATEREIGIDIEQPRTINDLEEMARAVMSPAEFSVWSKLSLVDRNKAFYRLWTRKEAYLKAIGLGLYPDLRQVSVPFSPETMVMGRTCFVDGAQTTKCLAEVVGDQQHDDKWTWLVTDLPTAEQHSASICFSISSEDEALPSVTIRNLEIPKQLDALAATDPVLGSDPECQINLLRG